MNIPLLISRFTIGIKPHSHTGNKNPSIQAKGIPNHGFFGVNLRMISSETNCCISEDTNMPRIKKGNVSSTIPKRMV